MKYAVVFALGFIVGVAGVAGVDGLVKVGGSVVNSARTSVQDAAK